MFNYFGRPIGAPFTDEANAPEKIKLIKDVNSAIRRQTGNEIDLKVLASHEIIHNAPSWDAVVIAIRGLEDFLVNEEEYDDLSSDYNNVREYYARLSSRLEFLTKAIVLIVNLKRLSPQANWNDCLSAISKSLDLRMGENVDAVTKFIPDIDTPKP